MRRALSRRSMISICPERARKNERFPSRAGGVPPQVSQHGFKRGEVAVNVRDDGNAHVECSRRRRRSFFDMQAAGAILANCAVPTVTIARDPCINSCGQPADSRYLQNPGEQIPAGEQRSNARPRVSAGKDAALRIHRLHPFHGFFAIDLRKALRHRRVVQVEQFDAAARIKTTHAIGAGTAQRAGTVEKDCKVSHEAKMS